ncbi:hypothetical protein TREMEDRAFT_65475 [Tremella mesenterica DSM 1558]|uniref:uncharacterized protein n=1 Tax=Tremella mesenterica (strain ATCC 24925 / CBS 8224 / DSM 1558 / NBRC 9311 / NRRL Y-6157 / RJB 2259-6 / UBC 559-6) TaxID=578456 RepID=UPI00032C500E|nr:uncharacterized protein TREMEDRAFT_65475 [Tremella mesenterica DSM 1558]EIW66604.1 hypothetical protein TREMEDRAFT_65475 [Tremella mesenterica DSM 1558]
MGLVDYDSSDDSIPSVPTSTSSHSPNLFKPETETATAKSSVTRHPSRKRPLPSLPTTYTSGLNPSDDPTLHQGRKRTRPFVEGEYSCHIYVSLSIPTSLRSTLNEILITLKRLLPTKDIHPTHDLKDLHISLSHPLGLRRSQIPTFLSGLSKAVKDVKKTILPMIRSTSNISSSHETSEMGGDEKMTLRLSLAGNIKVYLNGKKRGGQGDGGRAFFALRLGAGDPESSRDGPSMMSPDSDTCLRWSVHAVHAVAPVEDRTSMKQSCFHDTDDIMLLRQVFDTIVEIIERVNEALTISSATSCQKL